MGQFDLTYFYSECGVLLNWQTASLQKWFNCLYMLLYIVLLGPTGRLDHQHDKEILHPEYSIVTENEISSGCDATSHKGHFFLFVDLIYRKVTHVK